MRCMDRLDRKILSVLQANARASLQEIGQAVGLSPSPCWGRIKKMEEAGVIEGYTVRINPQALDLADTVLVQVTLDSHSDNTLEKFGETLASIPEVIEAHLVSGDYDYLLRVVVKDSTKSKASATAVPASCCARSKKPTCLLISHKKGLQRRPIKR